MTIKHTTYAPDLTIFCDSVIKLGRWIFTDTCAAVAVRVEKGWTQTDVNQVAKVDEVGFIDVITYLQERAK